MTRRYLLVNQFYPPDPAPTGRLLHDVAAELVARGNQVRVLCSRKEYGTGRDLGGSGTFDGVQVHRLPAAHFLGRGMPSRILDDGLFLAEVFWQTATSSQPVDLVVAATSPPFVGLAVALASRRRSLPHAHWTMDVYPDVLEAHWAGGGAAWVRRLLASAARFQFRGAVLVLTLGPFMNERVARYASTGRTRPVPLWTDLHAHAVASPSAWRERRGWHEDDLVLLYSGNMGRGHRMEEFLEAARRLGPHGPVWAFVGGGPRRHEVDRFRVEHADARIELLPAVAPDEVAASLLAGDVHLVSMATRWQGLIVPSKLAAAFALGRPAIFVGGRENEIAACIAESGGGWRVDEGDVDALVRAVGEARQPEERARRGKAAQEYARVHFDRVRNVARVADLLEQAASGPLP